MIAIFFFIVLKFPVIGMCYFCVQEKCSTYRILKKYLKFQSLVSGCQDLL